jgi:hypothetical protein
MQDNLNLAADILSHLMNSAPVECWGRFTQQDISDALNCTFALAGLLELRETERQQHAQQQLGQGPEAR